MERQRGFVKGINFFGYFSTFNVYLLIFSYCSLYLVDLENFSIGFWKLNHLLRKLKELGN